MSLRWIFITALRKVSWHCKRTYSCRCITWVWGCSNWINGCSHGQRISVIHPDLCVSDVRSRALHALWYEGRDPRLMTCCQGITQHKDWARQYGRVSHLVCVAFTIVSCQTRWGGAGYTGLPCGEGILQNWMAVWEIITQVWCPIRTIRECGFSHAKIGVQDCKSEMSFVVSSIKIYNLWCVMWHILHWNDNLTLIYATCAII